MGEGSDCPYVADDDVVPRYLRTELDPMAAEAFEAHYFACEHCWGEVEVAAAMRSQAGISRQASEPSKRRAPRQLWLVAAASLAVAAAILLPSARKDAVWRSMPRDSFALSVSETAHSFLVTWPAVEAAKYQVDVTDAEGAVLSSRQLGSTRIEILKSELGHASARPLYVRVQALEAPGKTVASAIQKLDFVRR